MEQEQSSPPQSRFGGSSQAGGAKKLTWSERQALAKKQAEEDEAKSRNFQQEQPSPSQSRFIGSSQPDSAKKLTWSERQALAKEQAEQDEAKSRNSGFVAPAASPISKPVFTSSAPAFGRATGSQSAPRNFGALGVAAGVGAVAGGTAVVASKYSDNIASARAAVQDAAWGRDEEDEPQPEEEEEQAAPVSSTHLDVYTST